MGEVNLDFTTRPCHFRKLGININDPNADGVVVEIDPLGEFFFWARDGVEVVFGVRPQQQLILSLSSPACQLCTRATDVRCSSFSPSC